jgi:hypothetical protein
LSFLVVCRFWKISAISFLFSKLKDGFYIVKFSTMYRLGNLGSNGTTSGIWIHLYSGTSGPGASNLWECEHWAGGSFGHCQTSFIAVLSITSLLGSQW